MSRAWYLNIPGFIIYGLIGSALFIVLVVRPSAGFLNNDENLLWLINLIADNCPGLFRFFSEFHFLGNYILAVYSFAFFLMLVWLVSFQAFVKEKTRSDDAAARLGHYMYIPLILAFMFLFCMSLLVAVYFYPNI